MRLIRCGAIAALVAAASSPPTRAGAAEPLDVDLARDGAVVAAAAGAALGLALLADETTPDRCRSCDPGPIDLRAREALRWPDEASARLGSDLVANGLLPALAVGHAALAAAGDGGPRQAAEDLLVVAEAALLSVDLNQAVKGAAGRQRPSAWAEGRLEGTDSNRSFYSGHTSFAFSLAASAGTVATLRGYRSAPWVWAVGMTLAAGVGWLRVAGDAHWLTDVAAGAALGGGIGVAVPWLLHRPRRGGAAAIELRPAPGGFALRF